MLLRGRTMWLKLSLICGLVLLTSYVGSLGAVAAFPSPDILRTWFGDEYPWFLEGAIHDQLLVEMQHDDLYLVGFTPNAGDEAVGSDQGAFFLTVREEEGYRVNDVSGKITPRLSYLSAEPLELPGSKGAILVKASYFTLHELNAQYVVTEDGVILGVEGDIISMVYEPHFHVSSRLRLQCFRNTPLGLGPIPPASGSR